ncbi:MAG: hypothetical protein EON54_14765, partial [Alcaligenaceae bacterium]
MPFRTTLKQQVRMLLARHAPRVYARLQRPREPVSDPSNTLSAVWERRPAVLNAESDLHAVLADPDLLALERPEGLDAEFMRRRMTPDNEALEPVVDLNQMRQSTASVCFVVPVQRNDLRILERTMQSVLRQTDPGWELLLCSAQETKVDLGRWLEIDWRVRRFTSPTHLDDSRYLAQAAVQATTTFVGLLLPGNMVDDDLVKAMGEKTRSAPTTDLIYTHEALFPPNDELNLSACKPDRALASPLRVNMRDCFVAVRKSLLLRATSMSDRGLDVTEPNLFLDLGSRARRVLEIDSSLYIRGTDASARPVDGLF